MKILVTGGAGFVGANLVRALESELEVNQINVIDDFSFGSRDNLAETSATVIEVSILDQSALSEAVRNCSAVVHLAAQSSVPRSIEHPLAAHEINASGTVRVLEAARAAGVLQVIVASSSSVYGRTEVLPKNEDLPTRPMSPYAASKLATESYALAWGECYDLPVLAFRFFNIFGPLQSPSHAYAAAIPAFLGAAFQDRPLPVYGDGIQSRDFTFVDSVVRVLIEALRNRTRHPEPVNLAFGSQTSLLELIEHMERILGRPLPVEFLPARVGDILHSRADDGLLRTLFPSVEPINLVDGLQATVDWFEAARPWEKQDPN